VTTTSNAYCAALGISPPRIDDAKARPDANYYSLLIIALLERGGPMTLAEAAARFAAAGVTSSANEALAALKRCKPARAPIYRDGDSYALDPHDDEVDFWLFRLGLRPARSAPLRVAPNASVPLPSADQPLTVAALDEGWREGVPNSWSAQRVAVAVLDAHQSPMSSDEVIAFVWARSRWSPLRPESAQFWRSGAIVVREDGVWELARTHEVVRSTREAVRNRVSDIRRWAAMRPDTVAMEAHRQRIERERTAHARELAAMRRVLVHAFPATRPRAVALVDVGAREVTTFLGDEITPALQRLSEYDIIGAVNVRALLRELGVDHGKRRLAELGPPQKTIQLNRRGRTLTITTALLIQGSCGISRPLGDERTMREYFRSGAHTKLRRRLEADAKSLLDQLDDGVKDSIIDALLARGAKATSGWKPARPSRRIVEEAKSFSDAARQIGQADPDDVTEHLRHGFLRWAEKLRQQYWRRHAFREELARASESLGVTLTA